MSKCLFCDTELSDKVLRIHQPLCKKLNAAVETETPEKIEEKEIRAKAKELKITSWHVKGLDTLKAEIAEIEGD